MAEQADEIFGYPVKWVEPEKVTPERVVVGGGLDAYRDYIVFEEGGGHDAEGPAYSGVDRRAAPGGG